MKKYVFLKRDNILLINFLSLFKKIEVECLNELHKYNLDDNFKINNRDTKRILYHEIIHGICEEIVNNKHNYTKVLVIPTEIPKQYEIRNYCSSEDFIKMLNTLIKGLQKYLPFVIIYDKDLICEDIFNTNINCTGEKAEMVNIISSMIDNIQNRKYSFEKIKLFSEKYGLLFLKRDYFDEIRIKQQLLR